MPMPGRVRRLTQTELGALPAPIAKVLDISRIEIHNRRWTWLTPPNVTVARGYRIYWPNAPIEATTLPLLAHLVHEVVHIWQYNHLKVGLYSWRWLDRRYGYNLHSDDEFFAFGLEQQASIIEDLILQRGGYKPRHAKNNPPPELYSKMMSQLA